MRVFLDTNILIDIVLNRKPWVDAALVLLELSRQKRLPLVASDISFVNLAYVLRKAMSPADMYSTMTDMLRYMSVAAAGESIITEAVSLRWKDMEDCVQYLSARQAGADCVISRNAADFGEADIPVMTPVEFLSTIL